MNFYLTIGEAYLCFAFSFILHEVFHLIAAKILGFRDTDIYLGSEFFRVNIGRVHISPVIFFGYVEFPERDLKKIGSREIVFLFLSGPFANLLLAAVSLVASILMPENDVFPILLSVNLMVSVFNLCPLKFTKSDMGACSV